jgi:hypothetical protein
MFCLGCSRGLAFPEPRRDQSQDVEEEDGNMVEKICILTRPVVNMCIFSQPFFQLLLRRLGLALLPYDALSCVCCLVFGLVLPCLVLSCLVLSCVLSPLSFVCCLVFYLVPYYKCVL